MSNILSLSLFGSGKRESHEQDGETLSRAHHAQIETASGDPAMAFMVFHRLANGHSVRALGGCCLEHESFHAGAATQQRALLSPPTKRARKNPRAKTITGECRASR
jgi:hypothetical protein